MVNKISLQCPDCECKEADVMAIIEMNGKKKVYYRCLGTGKKHNYFKSLTEDTQYQKFFDVSISDK